MHGLEPGCQQYQRLSWDSAQLHCQASLLCVSLQQNQDPAPRLQCCFLTASPLSLHPFPLLISNGSNLPFGTLKVKEIVTQLCPTFCDHMDCSLPWFSVHGIFQARINWSRLPFPSLGKSSLPRDWTQVSCLAGRFFTETNQKSPFGTQERSWRLECVLYRQSAQEFYRVLLCFKIISSVQFSCSVVSNSLRPHGLPHARPPCPSPTPRVYSDPCPLSWWCHPTISSSVIPSTSFKIMDAVKYSTMHRTAHSPQ